MHALREFPENSSTSTPGRRWTRSAVIAGRKSQSAVNGNVPIVDVARDRRASCAAYTALAWWASESPKNEIVVAAAGARGGAWSCAGVGEANAPTWVTLP